MLLHGDPGIPVPFNEVVLGLYTDSFAFIPVNFLSLFELMAAGVVGAEALLPLGEGRGRVQADCMLPAQA